jgi:hypothetical protein
MLPAIRLEDIISENKSLKQKVKEIENERDWLRRRIEQLEERSGREQMLLLSEKETLREVLNATIIREQAAQKPRIGLIQEIRSWEFPKAAKNWLKSFK